MPLGGRDGRTADVAEAAAFFVAVLAYLWLLVIPLPWTGVLLLAATALSWRRRRLSAHELGLSWGPFLSCWRSWAPLWILSAALMLALGYGRLFHLRTLTDGGAYFAWSALQQAVYQSMTYLPLRESLGGRMRAAALAGLAFAAVHAPNPILVPATLVWGMVSSLLFERCRSVWGLALLQTMLSSVLLWIAPAEWSRSFRIGPYYFRGGAGGRGGGGWMPPVRIEPYGM
ncbi:MAG: hypothetical protein K6T61_05640 [Bryobacteraceae bacterium]|nr:hypothetical protein [Bryobacteraceae bacterium]